MSRRPGSGDVGPGRRAEAAPEGWGRRRDDRRRLRLLVALAGQHRLGGGEARHGNPER